MKLRLLLWFLARRMELLARTSADFIAKVHGRQFVIQISSDRTHRYFQIQHNRVYSQAVAHPAPDLTLQFESDATAFRLLAQSSATEFMQAVQAQQARMSGDAALLLWFMSVSKHLRPGRRPAA